MLFQEEVKHIISKFDQCHQINTKAETQTEHFAKPISFIKVEKWL